MRAAVLERPQQIALRDVPDPVPERGGVVLRVEACAVCGTDVRIYTFGHARITLPAVIGHEIAGTVVEAGEDVDGYAVGDAVVLSPAGWSCGECRICRRGQENLCGNRVALSYEYPGGFAEYVAVPAPLVANGSLHRVPSEADPAEVAITEPLACCINGQEQVRWRPDDRVLVIGAGPIGVMHAELVRARGAEAVAVMDVSDRRLDVARSLAGVTAIDGRAQDAEDRVAEWSGGDGPDVVIVATSAPDGYRTAFAVAGRCGQVLLFAGLPKDRSVLDVDMNVIHYRQLAWYGSFGSTPAQGDRALRLLLARDVDPGRLVTHRFGLDALPAAVEAAKSLAGLKVVVEPKGAPA